MANELETLQQEVAENKTVMQSAITLLNGLKQRLDEALANNNLDAIRRLSTDLDTNTNDLAVAITANTPAANEPTAEPGGETPTL